VACFDKVIESLDIAEGLGERPDILFTFSDENAAEAAKIYEQICKPRGLMLILNPMFSYQGVGAHTLAEGTLQQMEALARKPLVYMNAAFVELRRQGGNKINAPACRAGDTTVVISPQNTLILPCYHLGLEEYPINGNLQELWNSQLILTEREKAGKLPLCQGCTVNCYMQPSMATKVDSFFWMALPSTLKYTLEKGTWKRLLPHFSLR
jgi:hypothetical protein